MTEYEINPVGGDYAAVFTALNALPNEFVDDYKLIVTGATAETGTHAANLWNHAGHYVEITADIPSGGDPTTGPLLSLNPGVNEWLSLAPPGATQNHTFKIHDLNIRRTGGGVAPTIFLASWGIVNATNNIEVYNNVFDGNALAHHVFTLVNQNSLGYFRFYNNKCFGFTRVQLNLSTIVVPGGIIIENNTIDGQDVGGGAQEGILVGNSKCTLRNNIFIRNDSNDIRVGGAASVVIREGNATSDATGDAGLQNIVSADEFESLTDTDADYLFLKDGAVTGDFTRKPAGDVYAKQKILFTPEITYVQVLRFLPDMALRQLMQRLTLQEDHDPALRDGIQLVAMKGYTHND